MKGAFTHCINTDNVNQALSEGLVRLHHGGAEEPSRNGSVMVMRCPVVTCYAKPTERVLFSAQRDANPFFHLMESLWMLAGRNDVAWPVQFNSRFGQFSDDGTVFHGAYGHRWRQWFGYDQLALIITELKANPETRRANLQMWDATLDEEGDGNDDLHQAMMGGKDVPCNTNVFFRIQEGKLDMMVNCRSNDILWGAYGANAVHFSMLLEYVALSVGVEVGRYWQNSWNFHAYTNVLPRDQFLPLAASAKAEDLYKQGKAEPFPIMSDPIGWDADLERFMDWAWNTDPDVEPPHFADRFFAEVAVPMRLAWAEHKLRNYKAALNHARDIFATDWQLACRQWLNRRAEAHDKKERGAS